MRGAGVFSRHEKIDSLYPVVVGGPTSASTGNARPLTYETLM